MLIPKIFYGKTALVKRECKKLAKKIRKGLSFEEVYGNLELINTSAFEGHIVLSGPNPLVGGQPHFHVYIWLWMISESFYSKNDLTPMELIEKGFQFAINQPWSLLAFQSSVNGKWFVNELQSMWPSFVRFYNIYEAEGERFSLGSCSPSFFWDTPTAIAGAMIKMGVPKKEFMPPPGKELIPYTYPPFWHLVKKYNLPTDFPPYIPTIQ